MSELTCEVVDGVATVSINRPPVRNALNRELIKDFHVALDAIQKPKSAVRAVILTGSESAFCSGVELQHVELSTSEAQQQAHTEMRRFMDPLILRLSEFRLPVLAAVNGAAVGAGMSLALVADVVIAADSAVFHPSFIKLGLVPDCGIIHFLSRRIGAGRSLASLLLAERIDAKTALDWGLVYSIFPLNELLEKTHLIAQQLASGPACAIAKLRNLPSVSFSSTLRQHLQAEMLAQKDSLATGDCVEGVRAFFEKRLPAFRA